MSALDDLCSVPFHEAGDAARAAILRQLADTELFLALAEDPRDDIAAVLRLPLDGAEVALACDDDGRLAGALGRPVAHVALPGREVARRLGAEGLPLLVNPGAPSAMLLDAPALAWLAQALAAAPTEVDQRARSLSPPDPGLVAALAPALGRRLADMAGLTTGAVLVAAQMSDGSATHLAILSGTPDAARPALAKAVSELIAFLPPLPVPVDVSFADHLPIPAGAVSIRVEPAPKPPAPAPDAPAEPRPPRLRF
ncbi:hypothetical protein DRW48_08980 [Paracoccus suum]|uniref:SseB protein N-terminal domain-containing protein n=1 Tax=Paracoccus suum TaxID=2259340 RepID=A0A344PK97_9RHOB|nr:hypothetical protein [Paracoccus suum]AXC49802.1 hypothetical protein DRW48_08980 [Paracoccus suum]